MEIELVGGCLLEAFDNGEISCVAHCVNTRGVMGAGLAAKLKSKYPLLFDRYKRHCSSHNQNDLLGSNYYTTVQREGVKAKDDEFCSNKDNWNGHIINMFAQLDFGTKTRQVNYGAISSCLSDAVTSYCTKGTRIGFPYGMCCGLAGGDWNVILEMIEFYFKDHNVKIYKL